MSWLVFSFRLDKGGQHLILKAVCCLMVPISEVVLPCRPCRCLQSVAWVVALVMLACLPQFLPAVEETTFHIRLADVPVLTRADGRRRHTQSSDFYLTLSRHQGRWGSRAWMYASMWQAQGEQQITISDMQRGSLRLGLRLPDPLASEAAVLAGADEPIDLTIVLHREDDDWQAAYHGSQGLNTFAGQATVIVMPHRVTDTAPIEPGEHPRLVFRRQDITDLRRRANSGHGADVRAALRALLERDMRWRGGRADAGSHAAGWAMLYLLDEDPAAARQAQSLVERRMRRPIGGRPLFDAAEEVVAVALAYDMCYDAWEEDFRIQVADWLIDKARQMLAGQVRQSSRAVASHWNAVCRGAAVVAALAVAGDPGSFPPRPTEAVYHALEPVDGPDLAEDRPVVRIKDGEVPQEWILAGPFHDAAGVDVLSPLGGGALARPMIGQDLRLHDQQQTFRAMPAESMWRGAGGYADNTMVIDLLQAIERAYHTTSIYHTVLRVDRQLLLRYRTNPSFAVQARSWLGGQELREYDLVRLEPGLYPLTLQVEIGETEPWGKLWIAPRFEVLPPVSGEALQVQLRRRQDRWQREHLAWEAAGRPVPGAHEVAASASRMLQRYLVFGMGEQGSAAEGDYYAALGAARGLFPALVAWRTALGEQVPGEDRARHFMTSLALRRQVVDDQLLFAVFGRGGAHLGVPELFALGAGLMTPAQQGVWTRLTRHHYADPPLGLSRPQHAIYAMARAVTVPDDDQMPHRVLDRQQGLAVWRSGADDQAVVATMYLKSRPVSGTSSYPEAGSFRILGFGQEWAVRGPGEATRRAENVVQVDSIEAWGGATVLAAQHDDRHRSGSLLASMRDVYRERDGRAHAVEGRRLFAVDYSGRCGVPALFVVVDEVEGGEQHRWRMNTAITPEATDTGFVLRGEGGYNLQATVLAPEDATVRLQEQAVEIVGHGRFVVVMTLGEGEAPLPSRLAWTDDELTMRVGRQRVRLPWGR